MVRAGNQSSVVKYIIDRLWDYFDADIDNWESQRVGKFVFRASGYTDIVGTGGYALDMDWQRLFRVAFSRHALLV
ncbi:hypothetical protein GCM10023333_14750 [Ferrimonas pelagia]|uniref:Uncharacterized protein n=1 Tax=Ferrimonas pelagia TaxID=1177826 RepID=A0ABP9EKM9_9GAMM